MRHPFRRCHYVPPYQPFHQILTAVAAHLEKGVVGIGYLSVGSEEYNTDRFDPDRPLQPLLRFTQFFFRPFALSDIAGDRRGAHNVANRVSDRRDSQRDVQPPAVLGYAHGLKVVNLLPPADAFEYTGCLVGAFGRYQHGDRLPHSLLGRVTVDPLRSLVPVGDDTL